MILSLEDINAGKKMGMFLALLPGRSHATSGADAIAVKLSQEGML